MGGDLRDGVSTLTKGTPETPYPSAMQGHRENIHIYEPESRLQALTLPTPDPDFPAQP